MTALRTWNQSPSGAAVEALLRCSASERWAEAVVARRPLRSIDALVAAAREEWLTLDDDEWLEVLASHDRLAERDTRLLSPESIREQEAIYADVADVRRTLGRLAAEYERIFGFMFVTAAAGRSTAELIGELKTRMLNSRTVELSTAVMQHQIIAEHRLLEYVHLPAVSRA